MSAISLVRVSDRQGALALQFVRALSDVSLAVCAALLIASIASIALVSPGALRPLRTGMLQFGLPLLGVFLAADVFAMRHGGLSGDARELYRLRERVCVVAALVLTVLLPSAVLGARGVLAPRPGNTLAVWLVEVLAWVLATWLLLGNAADARKLAPPARLADQADAAREPERSMSSIR